jgi:hypothetical protein
VKVVDVEKQSSLTPLKMDGALYETYETRRGWLSTSGEVYRRQAHWIKLSLIDRSDGLPVQGDLKSQCRERAVCRMQPRRAKICHNKNFFFFSRPLAHVTILCAVYRPCRRQKVAFSSPTPVALVSESGCRSQAITEIKTFSDTSCILAWLIEEGYEVYAFLADVGQEEVGIPRISRGLLIISHEGFRGCPQESLGSRSKKVLPRG